MQSKEKDNEKLKTLERNWKPAISKSMPNNKVYESWNFETKQGFAVAMSSTSSIDDAKHKQELESSWKPVLGKPKIMSIEQIFFKHKVKPKLVKRWSPLTANADKQSEKSGDSQPTAKKVDMKLNPIESKPRQDLKKLEHDWKHVISKPRPRSADQIFSKPPSFNPIKTDKIPTTKTRSTDTVRKSIMTKPWICSSAKIKSVYPNTWLPGKFLLSKNLGIFFSRYLSPQNQTL
jgi:hypothetical protein